MFNYILKSKYSLFKKNKQKLDRKKKIIWGQTRVMQ